MTTGGFAEHELRQRVLNEIHARPFHGVRTPRNVFHYAFITDGAAADRDRRALIERCRELGVAAPGPEANHHLVTIDGVQLRWETHSEFVTYTWDMEPDPTGLIPSFEQLLKGPFTQPGPLMVATKIELVADNREISELLDRLDPGTTAVSWLRDHRVIGATDFQLDASGMSRILLVDRGLHPHEVGPVVIRLIELETYRTLALLGLPEARRLQPLLRNSEAELTEATAKIASSSDLTENRALLEQLTKLAGDLEAEVSNSAFRFAASRAYADIVQNRLAAVREDAMEGYTRWSSFLQRRMGPAMRTCNNVEARLREVADRLSRAANLLRTRIEVDLEQQNRELLASMNRRAQLQLRLQQWVEGLSVAAVSYYVVSLIYYLARGADAFGVGVDPSKVTALAIPPIAAGIWLFVRSVRRKHAGEQEDDTERS